jgi:uncharacterized protein (DUF362 family)/Pyruvate/2-oxoacid:ferredoxin oxidoreductase delta subunit
MKMNAGAERSMKVSAVRCASYDSASVERAMRKSIDELGGARRFVAPGETILLKPNLLSPKDPDAAVTTHPEILRAAIHIVRDAGGVPVVGDSPGGRSTERILRNLTERTGIERVCEEEHVEIVPFIEAEKVPFPEGVVAKSFELTTVLKRVDGVISLAKMKTHTFTGLTGAVKNLFGLIPGIGKAGYHLRMQTPETFSAMLVDLAECVRPRLTIMDAIVAMHGDGPAAGMKMDVGLIISGEDPHALDAFFAEIVGADISSVHTVRIARKRGLIPTTFSASDLVDGNLSDFKVSGFMMPSAPRYLRGVPRVFYRTAGDTMARKPSFSKKNCTKCGRCIETCPSGALSMGPRRPRIARELCIRCYCCQELCLNDAVKLRRMPARALVTKVTSGVARATRRKDEGHPSRSEE